MRSIPFRVVCVLGLDDGAFPRAPRPPGFDLIARHPRPGDRSAREEDRQLFLDALLSAGDRLWLGYTGIDPASGGPLPPSPVLAELIDVLQHTVEGGLAVHRHPRAPFHPALFAADARFPSHDAAAAAGARSYAGPRVEPVPFFSAPLVPELPAILSLDELVRFFEDPARALLQSRLQMRFPEDDRPLQELPPSAVDGLAEWSLAERWLARAHQGGDAAATEAALRSENRLPPGTLGSLDNRAARARGEGVWALAAPFLAGGPLPEPPRVDLTLPVGEHTVRLRGWLAGARPSGLVTASAARLKGKRIVRAAVLHLALQVASGAEGRSSVLIGRPATGDGMRSDTLPPMSAAAAQEALGNLLTLWAAGMRSPIPFWPDAALGVAAATSPEAAAAAVRTAWDKALGYGALPRPLSLLWSRDTLAVAPGLITTARAVVGLLGGTP